MASVKRKRQKSIWQRARENEGFQKSLSVILPVMLGIIILILWQSEGLHAILKTDTFTLPLPLKIINIFVDNIDKIISNTISTLEVAGIGLLIGGILGYLVAIIASIFPKMGMGGLSVVGAFASIPVVALAPVMNNWTKDISKDAEIRSLVAKALVVMLIVAANMTLNVYRGLTELKPFSEDLMATYAAKKSVVLMKLRVPNSLPFVFTALKVAVPASIMTAIVSEYFAEYITGVGRQIRENIVLAQYSTAWAYIITACIIGVISYALLMLVQAIVLGKYEKLN